MADTSVRIIVGLKDEFSRYQSRITNGLEQIRRQVFSLNTAIGVFGAGALAKGFLDTAAQMDKTLTLLKRLEGSGEAARASFEWMLKFGQNNAAVANIEQFQQAFVRLKVAGLDPASGSLQALTDAVAAFGGGSEDLQKASVAVFQMAGKGAINMEELRQQLGERVPTAMKIMARELNISVEQLNKFTETSVLVGEKAKMALSAMFQGFAKEYGGASKELASTWNGMVNQLGVKWELFKIKVMDSGPFKKMKETMAELLKWLDSPEGMKKMEVVAENVAKGFLSMANAMDSVVRNLDQITNEIGSMFQKWNELPQGLRDFLVAAVPAAYMSKNPIYGAMVGAGYATDEARARYVEQNFPQGGPHYVRQKVAGKMTGGFGGLLGNMNAEDYLPAAFQVIKNAKQQPYTYDASGWTGGGGAKAEAAARKAAAALAAFQNAVRDVNKEFAEVTGDKASVWLAQWEDKFADLQGKIMQGKNPQEVQAALARLKAADEATRKAIGSGYSSMVDAREDLEKFKQELAALDTGDKREDDRLKLNKRLDQLVGVGLVKPEDAEKYRVLQLAAWQKEKDRENLETKRSFYAEYIRIAGEGFAVIEDSILQQAQVYRNAKISEEHIARWVEYQKLQYSRDWADGATRALLEYANAATDQAAQMEQIFTNGFQSMEDALVQFTLTGKTSFESMINSMISDLMRFAIRSRITGPLAQAGAGFLQSLFSPGGGSAGSYSLMDGIGGWGGRASGGRTEAGRVYRVGENGMEWFAPGVDGVIIPNSKGGAGGSRPLTVNIIESQGKGGQQEQRQEGGEDVLDIFFDMIDTKMAQGVMNGGTKNSAALAHVYGLNRANGALR